MEEDSRARQSAGGRVQEWGEAAGGRSCAGS